MREVVIRAERVVVDSSISLERALERVRRANGTGTTLTLAGLVDEYSPSTTRSRRRSRSCLGCSRKPSESSVIGVSASFVRRRSRLGG
jgi:hypothetical protein